MFFSKGIMSKELWFRKEFQNVFECSIDLITEILQKELDGDAGGAEVFHDIHCPDPFGKKQDFVFPVVAVHSTGLYLVYLLNGSKKEQCNTLAETLEYACKVFKSYFFTKVPVHSIFAFEMHGRSRICPELLAYDYVSKELISDSIQVIDDLRIYIKKHIQNSDCDSPDDEREDLVLRLVKEESETLVTDSEDKSCFIKKGDKWFPAFNVNSERVFNLALCGGFFGIHRFYLGLYGSGLLYMFTFGLFGVGWVFDCFEMLLGCWRYNNKYLMPLKNKGRHTIKFLFVICCMIGMLYSIIGQSR